MLLLFSQATAPFTTTDPSQWTALAALIAIAISFVYTAVKWPADAKTERAEMTTAFGKMLDASHADAEKERTRMEAVINRVCTSMDNAVEEMRKCREQDRAACVAFTQRVHQ